MNRACCCRLVLAFSAVAFASTASAGQRLSWSEVELVSASGVPDGATHKYAFRGTLVLTEISSQSGFSFDKGFSTTTSSRVMDTIFVQATGEWNRGKAVATEKMKLTFAGGQKAYLSSEFRFAKDPWLVAADNSGVVIDVLFNSDKSPVPDFPSLVERNREPLTVVAANPKLAVELSRKAATPPPPPPPAPAPDAPRAVPQYDLSGAWTSNLGPVEFKQQGADATGTLRFSNGVVAVVNGVVQGDKFEFAWGIEGRELGRGTLTAYDSGQRLAGTYHDHAKGTTADWTLTRALRIVRTPLAIQPTPTQHNLAGKWSSNLGIVEFTQQGDAARGQLRFANGAIAVINGTVQGQTLVFKWGIAGQELGHGSLTASQDGQHWSGNYSDLSKGTTQAFALQRAP